MAKPKHIPDMNEGVSLSPDKTDWPAPLEATESSAGVSGCWSDIGVYGNGSCPELKGLIHCRNCPVYSAAGARFIDRPLPSDYRVEWTQHFAQQRRLIETGSASAIMFRIQQEWFALPTASFQEVAEKRPIHSLPRKREGNILGLANVRGELVVCVSVGHWLQLENLPSLETVREEYQRLLVLQWESNRLAFPVDEVQGPHRFQPHELSKLSAGAGRPKLRHAQALLHWQERAAGWLDPALIFSTLQQSVS